MRAPFFVVLLLGATAMAGPAEQRQAEQLLKKADGLYAAGKYLEAAAALEEAQALSPNPRILYNLAKAYDQAGELPKALASYQAYVASPEGTDATLLKRSSLSIDRLRGLQQKEEAAARERAEAERLRVEGERARETQAQAERERLAQEKLRAEAERGRLAEQQQVQKVLDSQRVEAELASRKTRRTAAYATGGAAVAGLGSGLVFGLLSRGSKGEFDRASTLPDKRSFESRAKSQALIADVGFGVGIAAAIAAVVLYPKGEDPVLARLSGEGGGLWAFEF